MTSTIRIRNATAALALVIISTACSPFIAPVQSTIPTQRPAATSPATPSVDAAGVPISLPARVSHTDELGNTSTVIEVAGTRGLLSSAPTATCLDTECVIAP